LGTGIFDYVHPAGLTIFLVILLVPKNKDIRLAGHPFAKPEIHFAGIFCG